MRTLPDAVFGMDPALLLSVVAGITVMAVAGGIVMMLDSQGSPRARLRKRMESMVGDAKPKTTRKTEGASRSNRRQIQDKLKEIEAKKKNAKRRNKVRHELRQAGVGLSLQKFALLSIVAGIACAGLAKLFGASLLAAVPLGVAIALVIPRWVLRFIARRRKKKFTGQFAGGLDIIVRGIQSGLPVDECFKVIAQESADPMGLEFRMMLEGQKLGLTTEEVMERAYDRLPTAELKFFATVLAIQKQTGGNLSETLTNLSKLLRERHRMEGKVRALSSEARASAMIIASLPFFVAGILSLANPDYLSLLVTDIIGHVMLAGCAMMVLVGTLVMKKMTSFEI